MSDASDEDKAHRLRLAYASAWEMELAFADEIAEANREHVLRLAAESTDPEDRRLLLRLAEFKLTGARDEWRIDIARREGSLPALVARIEKEQAEDG